VTIIFRFICFLILLLQRYGEKQIALKRTVKLSSTTSELKEPRFHNFEVLMNKCMSTIQMIHCACR